MSAASEKYSDRIKFICHRVNSTSEYPATQFAGMEFDVRDSDGLVLVTHDPFTKAIDLESFVIRIPKIKEFFYIVNIKSEGIEEKVREILDKYEMSNFVFLDSSFPTIARMSKEGEKRFAIRASEYESIQTAVEMSGKVQWVWIDCFKSIEHIPMQVMIAKGCGYNVCLVSPELHKHSNDVEMIRLISDSIKKHNLVIDAICCKKTSLIHWKMQLDNL